MDDESKQLLREIRDLQREQVELLRAHLLPPWAPVAIQLAHSANRHDAGSGNTRNVCPVEQMIRMTPQMNYFAQCATK